jgi:stage IV sporulation protein FB
LLLPISYLVSTISSERSISPQRVAVVFLLEPDETRYDLRWRMFGINVRVHPLFWIMTAVLGWDSSMGRFGGGLPVLLLWIACVFVSVLIHELGHVFMGRLFGSHGRIVLYSLGGLAIGSNVLERRWQRIAVSFAGPLAEFLLLGAILVLFFLPHANLPERWQPYLEQAWEFMIWINFFWGLVNLLPIWPLDGGHIAREICQAITPRKGVSFSLGISMVVSGFLAIHMLMASKGRPLLRFFPYGDMFMAIFFAMFCLSSFMALQAEDQRRSRWSDDDWPWRR